MIRFLSCVSLALILSACSVRAPQNGVRGNPNNAYAPRAPIAGQGQYIRPAYLNPEPTPRIPNPDVCRSQLYQGLLGQHEGAIYIAGLPGRKRVLKPAFLEDFEREVIANDFVEPPLIEVRDYLPQQVLYAPSIRTVSDLIELGPDEEDRLTIELDEEGYVQVLRCG